MMRNRTLFPGLSFGHNRCLNSLQGEACAVFHINNSHGADLYPTLNPLSGSAVKVANVRSFLAALWKIRRVISQNQILGTVASDKIYIESNPVKRFLHLVTVGLFIKNPVSGHVDEVVFTSESHIKDQKMLDKFLSWFGYPINLCYYCIDEDFSLIEKKHHSFEFSNTTKQMLFSFGFSPSGQFLQTGHC